MLLPLIREGFAVFKMTVVNVCRHFSFCFRIGGITFLREFAMPTDKKPPIAQSEASAAPTTGKSAAAPRVPRGTKPAAVPRVARGTKPPAEKNLQPTPPVAAPPAAAPVATKRKKLSKAFSRPLDKVLRNKSAQRVAPETTEQVTVRDGFTFPKSEHEHLVRIKKELAEQGVMVKKSELMRAALILLRACPLDRLKALLNELPKIQ